LSQVLFSYMVKTWKYLKDLTYRDTSFRCKGVYILYDLKTKDSYIGCSMDIYGRLRRHRLKYTSKSIICGILLNGKENNCIKLPGEYISEIYFVKETEKNWHYKLESKYIKRYKPNLNSFNIRNIKFKHRDLLLPLLKKGLKGSKFVSNRLYARESISYIFKSEINKKDFTIQL